MPKSLKRVSREFTILYLEPNPTESSEIETYLKPFFKIIYTAQNTQDALEIFRNEHIDILLCTIEDRDGLVFLKQIFKIESNPIIAAISSLDEQSLFVDLVNMEIKSLVPKPIEKELLTSILHKNCIIAQDKKVAFEYSLVLEKENEEVTAKNAVLELKLKQLASQTNEIQRLKDSMQGEELTLAQEFILNPEVSHSDYFAELSDSDKADLLDLSQEIDLSITLMFQQDTLDTHYITTLSNLYREYSSILNAYSDFHLIAQSLHVFANKITEFQEKFLEDISQTGVLFESLQLTLETFRENIWENEAPDPTFYNASLINDIDLITNFLEEIEEEENEIDFF